MTWMVGGAALAAACLGVGALVGHWLEPEPGIIPSSAIQQAEGERLNGLLDSRPQQTVEEPDDEASAPLIPWVWLDEPARAEPTPRRPTWMMRSTCAISDARRIGDE